MPHPGDVPGDDAGRQGGRPLAPDGTTAIGAVARERIGGGGESTAVDIDGSPGRARHVAGKRAVGDRQGTREDGDAAAATRTRRVACELAAGDRAAAAIRDRATGVAGGVIGEIATGHVDGEVYSVEERSAVLCGLIRGEG